MSIKYSKNGNKYVKDIIDVSWQGITAERGYLSFDKLYAIVLLISDEVDSRQYVAIEDFWYQEERSKEDLINNIKDFIAQNKNLKVEDLALVEAKQLSFD